MKRIARLGGVLLAAGLSVGCVERTYTIYSDPPGAMVFRNGVQLGPTPVDDHFVYYGTYKFTLIKEGYETLEVSQAIKAPWYDLPGIDFVTENLIPYRFRDSRTFRYQLLPLQNVRHDDVLNRANDLRERGRAITPPPGAAPPRSTRAPSAVPPVPGAPPAAQPTARPAASTESGRSALDAPRSRTAPGAEPLGTGATPEAQPTAGPAASAEFGRSTLDVPRSRAATPGATGP